MNTNFNLLLATPMYNAEKYLPRLVQSIAEYPNVTWIVLDDGSTDNTGEVLVNLCRQYKIDLHLTVDSNHGLTYGRNFLSHKFVTEFPEFTHMVFIDADDYFAPGWKTSIEFWLGKVATLYPNEKTPYLCFKYWNERSKADECQIYTKLNTNYKAHAAVCQYPDGGADLLHVIPREYLVEVKNWDGNYYHVVKSEKWTSDPHNFMAYLDYKCSFIGDVVAILGQNDGNMSDTYYDNIVTKYAKGQVDECMMFLKVYGGHEKGFDWSKIPGFRWRWYLRCLVRMIENGTLVFSGKKWDDFQGQPDELVESKHMY